MNRLATGASATRAGHRTERYEMLLLCGKRTARNPSSSAAETHRYEARTIFVRCNKLALNLMYHIFTHSSVRRIQRTKNIHWISQTIRCSTIQEAANSRLLSVGSARYLKWIMFCYSPYSHPLTFTPAKIHPSSLLACCCRPHLTLYKQNSYISEFSILEAPHVF